MKYLKMFENDINTEYFFGRDGEWPEIGCIFKYKTTGYESIVEVIGTFFQNHGDFNSSVGYMMKVKQLFKKPFGREWKFEDFDFNLSRTKIGEFFSGTFELIEKEKEMVDVLKNANKFGL